MYNLRALPPGKTQIANDESHGMMYICNAYENTTCVQPCTSKKHHINFSLGHLMFLDFWLKKKQAKSHKFLSWPLDWILDFERD